MLDKEIDLEPKIIERMASESEARYLGTVIILNSIFRWNDSETNLFLLLLFITFFLGGGAGRGRDGICGKER